MSQTPRVFFTADTHFGHANAIANSARPFANVDEMDQFMIDSWNAVVGPKDIVWFLGDFAYRNTSPAARVFGKLAGSKHLIIGNHDGREVRSLPWASQREIGEIVVEGQRLALCHYPLLEWPGAFRGALHLFGHVHGRRLGMPGSCDVGVDCFGFQPVTLAQIRERIAELHPEPTQDETPAGGLGR